MTKNLSYENMIEKLTQRISVTLQNLCTKLKKEYPSYLISCRIMKNDAYDIMAGVSILAHRDGDEIAIIANVQRITESITMESDLSKEGQILLDGPITKLSVLRFNSDSDEIAFNWAAEFEIFVASCFSVLQDELQLLH